MREIHIKYNPYRLDTEILVDGERPRQGSRLHFGDRRLQEWIEELPEILFRECSSREFHLIFHGTILDYEDVESMAAEAAKKGVRIELTHIPAKEVADKEAAISKIFNDIQAGPFEELKQPDVIKAFNLAKSSDFEVNVVATMSAGKSTLINAMLRQKLMPARQEACTATITEIKDTDTDHFSAKAYGTNGTLIQECKELTFSQMENWNNDPAVSRIRVEGNIPFVSAEDVSLVLVDTPGPNNSRDPSHKAATYRMLSESSKAVVLYIMNASQLSVNDDYHLLSHVADSMKVGGKQSRDRFIFVINKLDDYKQDEDDVERTLQKVREYLQDNDIENPNVYPASALTALNIRTLLAESDDDDDDDVYEANGKVRKFNRRPEMHFENLAPLTPSMRGEIAQQLADAQDRKDANAQALIHCGIVPIEMAIQTYVQKYAKTAKLKNIVDTFSKRLESAKSFETTKCEIAANKERQAAVLEAIAVIKKKQASGENAKRFKERVNQINYDGEIKQMASRVFKEAQKQLTIHLTNDENRKLSKRRAEELCNQFTLLANDLHASVRVRLENLIVNHVQKSASNLLEEYKRKLSDLTQEISVGVVMLDPFELMAGDISALSDVDSIMDSASTSEEVWEVVGSHKEYKEVFGLRRWFNDKFGTGFNVDYDIVKDYDWVTKSYIDGTVLAQKFFAPVEEQLRLNCNHATDYAKAQVQVVKKTFAGKFAELDAVLDQKLRELEEYTKDNNALKEKIKQAEDNLKWLEDIQVRINAILDI